ncbi:MAG: hypothetical protein R3D03_09765 [Geminicoccaceae bacterium]
MTLINRTSTSFTSGEIDPALAGRIDIQAWDEGAAMLRNVIVRRSGGVARRPGSRRIIRVPDARRLISFTASVQSVILVLSPGRLTITADGTILQDDIATPWTAGMIGQLTWTRIGDTLLFCHPEIQPRRLERSASGTWSLSPWSFETLDDDSANPPILQPYCRYVDSLVTLQATDLQIQRSSNDAIPASTLIRLEASADVFSFAHQGCIFRIQGREVLVQSVENARKAFATPRRALVNGKPTRDWDEQTFSTPRGWPVAVTQHQDRLVLAGNRSAPDRIVFSRTGRPFNFDPGTGLDDEAITFTLRGDQLHRIRQLSSGRRLQVFTDAGEWVVTGSPLTPATVQVSQQTHVGSPVDRQIRAIGIDGVTHFIGASLRDLREFLYTSSEQAFQAPDIAMLSRHLLLDPVDMEFDPSRRLLAIVRADGKLATVSIDRNANIVAWCLQETEGSYLGVAVHEDCLTALVKRGTDTWLEAFDDNLQLDGCIVADNDPPCNVIGGLGDLVGREVVAIADDVVATTAILETDSLDIGAAASQVVIGLPFEHCIKPMPLAGISGAGPSTDPLYRPVRLSFRVQETRSLTVDAGRGPEHILQRPTESEPLTGDVSMRALGWRRGYAGHPWIIAQRDPLPFVLLSATIELKVPE